MHFHRTLPAFSEIDRKKHDDRRVRIQNGIRRIMVQKHGGMCSQKFLLSLESFSLSV